MKKLVLVTLIIITLLLSGCSSTTPALEGPSSESEAPSSESEASSSESQAPSSASQAPVELSLSHGFPPGSGVGKTLQAWADSIGEETNGRVTITVYPAGSLLKAAEIYDGVAKGVADLAYGHPTDDMGRFGPYTAFALPCLDVPEVWPDVKIKTAVALEIRDKFPEIQAKHPDVEILFDAWFSPYIFQSPKKAVRVPNDIVGMKVAASGLFISLAETLGAVPVSVPAPDRYMSLERGLIDGSWDIWGGIFAMKHYEVSKYFSQGIDFGSGSSMVIMNKQKLNSLPADIQEIFRKQRDYALDFPTEAYLPEIPLGMAEAEKRKATFITPTPEEEAAWDKVLVGYYDVWVKDMEERGWPQSRDFLNELLRMIDSYR